MSLHQKIMSFLKESAIPYKEFNHHSATTCEESAKARGTELSIGGKTIFVRCKKEFYLFAIPAHKKANSNQIRKILAYQKVRFATKEELIEKTDALPGALPPLGPPVLPYKIYVDQELLKNDYIAFNTGITTHSVMLTIENYRTLFQFEEVSISI